ncbi:UNVERIFIED_CONTAM: hypothetical protein Sangu_2871300 [Sesamum angustifolium]|uniref:Uncharacterized protein n=1 Tax=Sesamum angustifolium TaxID=2727405 RepID=A0AAW2INP2_9LAMI
MNDCLRREEYGYSCRDHRLYAVAARGEHGCMQQGIQFFEIPGPCPIKWAQGTCGPLTATFY